MVSPILPFQYFKRNNCRVPNTEQGHKKLICSFTFSQVNLYDCSIHTYLRSAANLSWTYTFSQTLNWRMDRKHSGNSQLKVVLEFWNWPAHSSSYIKMLGRGRLSCQDPLHLYYAKTDTRSPWRGEDQVCT